MGIAVSATGPGLDASIDPRFGRCQQFVIVDPETMEFDVTDNASATQSGGAGIAATQMVAGQGVQAVLTGNCGPNAYQVLNGAGLEAITGASGTVREAVLAYRSGKLRPSPQATTPAHSGTDGGMGGTGQGMGRGMRRGMGRSPGR